MHQIERRHCTIAFFHQNEVEAAQGGVERYLSTLLDTCGASAVLVSEQRGNNDGPNRITIPLVGPSFLPKWIRFNLAVLVHSGRIRSELKKRNVKILEFSRPEYALFSKLFRGEKVFTFHGMGPNRRHVGQRLIHDATSLLMLLDAKGVQIVGRDNSALPTIVLRKVRNRMVHVDAWYDERFSCRPLPSLHNAPFICFYAGRLSEQKNPNLLFSVIERALAELPFPVEFRYFGGDSDLIEKAGLADRVRCYGLLGPDRLAEEIANCHVGILCSKQEGSPFSMIETLACGRAFVASPIPGLVKAYSGVNGTFFADNMSPDAFLKSLTDARAYFLSDRPQLVAERIAAGVRNRRQSEVALATVQRLLKLATLPEARFGDQPRLEAVPNGQR